MFLRRRCFSFGILLLACLALLPTSARANGRFPSAQQLVVHPRDPNRIWVRATHGVLTSGDRGANWHWVCEQSIDYSGVEDPAIGITASGTLLAGIFNGLPLTTDNGCDWRFEPTIGQQNVVDVSVEKNDPTRALAITSTGDGNGGYVNEVWRSPDSGATWAKIGPALDKSFLALTIDSAPSDPKTIYVTGFSFIVGDGGTDFTSNGVLLRSTDDGQTWTTVEVPGTSNLAQPFLSAVDPNDAKKLYIRVQGPDVEPGSGESIQNWLLISENGGDTYRELLRAQADFLGFALAPDGQSVFIGMGDAKALGQVRPGDKNVFGLYRADLPGLNFQRVGHMGGVPVGHIGCLTFDGDDLWVCTSEFTQGFELARSRDRGMTLEPVMHLADLQGPVQCGCDTRTGDLCPAQWQRLCETIGRCEFGVEDPVACGDGGGAGGAGGASGRGGRGGTNGASDAGGGAAGDDGGGSSCSCRAPGSGSLGTGALAALGLAFALRLVFTRRRRR
jgi:hypothetical protein